MSRNFLVKSYAHAYSMAIRAAQKFYIDVFKFKLISLHESVRYQLLR